MKAFRITSLSTGLKVQYMKLVMCGRWEVHTAKPLATQPTALEAETAVAEFESYITPDTDQIPEELIRTKSNTIQSEIHLE
jgi:hypothetical protein